MANRLLGSWTFLFLFFYNVGHPDVFRRYKIVMASWSCVETHPNLAAPRVSVCKQGQTVRHMLRCVPLRQACGSSTARLKCAHKICLSFCTVLHTCIGLVCCAMQCARVKVELISTLKGGWADGPAPSLNMRRCLPLDDNRLGVTRLRWTHLQASSFYWSKAVEHKLGKD